MKKKLAALALALTLLTVPAAAFSDVDEGLYYAAPIAWAVERGITTGVTEDTFSPDALCTQGQILTFLWRAAGSPEAEAEALENTSLNPDFLKAIGWGLTTGILDAAAVPAAGLSDGTSVRFDPSAPCSRGTAMDFLWRYVGSPAAGAPAAFTDVDPNADYARAVAWAVEQGITEGSTETTFSPNDPCTRGQIATFLYRCLNETGTKAEPSEAPAPVSVQDPEKEAAPLRVLTGHGSAYSLGLDGSAFTSDGIYEAEVTVELYSDYDAVFTVQVPFPLYQACSYTVRFDDPDDPGKSYLFTCLRWDEAFDDLISWEGEHLQHRFTDLTGSGQSVVPVTSPEEEDRIGGTISWRVLFINGGGFNFSQLENYRLSCEVNSSL